MHDHRDETLADMMQTYGLRESDIGARVTVSEFCTYVSQLGPGSRLWVALYGNAGRSFCEIIAAATLNQVKMAFWDGKGKQPALIDLGGKKQSSNAKEERYGKPVTTRRLVELMGDHIVRG